MALPLFCCSQGLCLSFPLWSFCGIAHAGMGVVTGVRGLNKGCFEAQPGWWLFLALGVWWEAGGHSGLRERLVGLES